MKEEDRKKQLKGLALILGIMMISRKKSSTPEKDISKSEKAKREQKSKSFFTKSWHSLSNAKNIGITIGVFLLAITAGGVTWATFSDVERSESTMEAGSLVLSPDSSDKLQWSLENLTPGDEEQRTITLKNKGSIDGILEVSSVEIFAESDNGCASNEEDGPEKTVDPNCNDESEGGELQEFTELAVWQETSDGNTNLVGNSENISNEELDQEEIISELDSKTDYGNSITLEANTDEDIKMKYKIPQNASEINAIQGDSMEFNIELQLIQE